MEQLLIDACYKGGEVVKNYLHKDYEVALKKNESMVTEVDKKSEQVIINLINKYYPHHSILSEESGEHIKQDTDYRWIIDPIDGTTNYFHKSPLCAVSIALEYKNKLIIGGVYNPFMNELFVAKDGEGASLNGTKFTIPKNEIELNQSIVVMYKGSTYGKNKKHPYHIISNNNMHTRKTGASAIDLCWVAMGRFNAFISAYPINSWDVAAGIVILREAGAKVVSFENDPSNIDDKNLIAGNHKLVNFFLQQIS